MSDTPYLPLTGDVDQCATAGRSFTDLAASIETSLENLYCLASDTTQVSQAADQAKQAAQQIATDLLAVIYVHQQVGDALTGYSHGLTDAKRDADDASRKLDELHAQDLSFQTAVTNSLSGYQSAQQQLANVSGGTHPNASAIQAASAACDAARASWQQAVSAQNQHDDDIATQENRWWNGDYGTSGKNWKDAQARIATNTVQNVFLDTPPNQLFNPANLTVPVNVQCPAQLPPDPQLVATLEAKLIPAALAAGKTPDDIEKMATDIATIVANADEPYKSLFLQHINDVTFKSTEGVAYYDANGLTNTLYVNFKSSFATDSPPYHTSFHEFGHAIDDQENMFGWESPRYTTTDGQTVYGAIKTDVTNNIRASINQAIAAGALPSMTDADKQAVVDAYFDPNPDYFRQHPEVKAALDRVYRGTGSSSDTTGALSSDYARGVGDVYNGATHGQIPAKWTHSSFNQYPDANGNGLQDDYWYGKTLDRNSQMEKEAWANFFADNMVSHSQVCPPGASVPLPDGTNLAITDQYLPSTSKVLADMAQHMEDT